MKIIDRISNITLASFFILVPLAFVSSRFGDYRVYLFTPAKEAVARILILWLLIFFLFQVGLFKKAVQKSVFYLPMFLFLLLGILSLTWAINPSQGFEQWLHWAALFFFFFVCLNFVKDISSIRFFMNIAVLTAALICFTSLVCYFFDIDLPFFFKRNGNWWATTFDNPKLIAEYVAPLLFWAVGLYFVTQKKGYLAIAALFLFCIVFVFKSRASLVGVFVPFLFYGKKRKVTIFCGLLVFILSLPLVNQILDGKYTNNRQRLVIWKNTVQMGKDHFWRGVGLGQFDLVYPAYAKPEDRFYIPETQFWNDYIHHAHNEYLHLFSELGFFGLAFFGFFFFWLVRSFAKRSFAQDDIRFFLSLSFLSQLVIAFFVYNFQTAPSAFFAMATLAFLIQLTNSEKSQVVIPVKAGTLILIPFLLFFAPKALVQSAYGKYYLHLGELLSDKSRPKAMKAFEKALSWNSRDWKGYFFIGNILGEEEKYEQAIFSMKRSLEFNPHHVITQYNLALYYEKNKQYSEAMQGYQKIISFAPDFRMAHNRLGHIYLKDRKIEDARHSFWKVLEPAAYQQGEMTKAFFGLFLCELKSNESKKALAWLREIYLTPKEDFTFHSNYFRLEGKATDVFQWWLAHL